MSYRRSLAVTTMLCGLLAQTCGVGRAADEDLRLAWFPKTERSQPGQATPRLTLEFQEEARFQEALEFPASLPLDDPEPEPWRPCFDFLAGVSLNGNNPGATNGDLAGGTLAGLIAFQYADTQRIVPLLGGHYSGVSRGGFWSTTFGLLRPAGVDRWLPDFDLGVTFNLAGADNLHGTSQQYNGSQISLAAGALLLPDLQLRLLYAHPLSGANQGTQVLLDQSPIGPLVFTPVTFQPRPMAQASLDYKINSNLIITGSLTRVTHPDQLFAGVAADWYYRPGRRAFVDVQLGEGGDIFAFAGLGFTWGSCSSGFPNGPIKPLFNPGQPVFSTSLAAVSGGAQCLPGSMLPCP